MRGGRGGDGSAGSQRLKLSRPGNWGWTSFGLGTRAAGSHWEASLKVESQAVLSQGGIGGEFTQTRPLCWLILFRFKAQTRSLCLNISVSEANQGMPTEQGPHRKVKPFPL